MAKPDRDSALHDPLARGKGRRLREIECEFETILDGMGEAFYSVERDWRNWLGAVQHDPRLAVSSAG